MKLIKTALTVIFLFVLAGGGFYFLSNRGVIPPEQTQAVQGLVKGTQIETLAQQITKPLQQLSLPTKISPPSLSQINQTVQTVQQAPSLASVASSSSSVLGSSVEVQTENPPLPQRAFEYARYTYCQEVIQDYETRYPEN